MSAKSCMPSIAPFSRVAAAVSLSVSLVVATAAAQGPLPGHSGAFSIAGEKLRSLTANLRASGLTNIASEVEKQSVERSMSEDALWALRSLGDRITFADQVHIPESKEVFDRAVSRDLPLMANVNKVELLKTFDAAVPPMRRNAGAPEGVEGAFSKQALVGTARSIMLWGPYYSFAPGRYLVAYRFQFIDEAGSQQACFFDVAHKAVTYSGRRPMARTTPARVWTEVAVPLGVPSQMQFEFRMWPEGRRVALDRIYVYRLTDRTDPGAQPPVSIMGAAAQTGFYILPNTETPAGSAFTAAAGLNALAHKSQLLVWRQTAGEFLAMPTKDDQPREEIAIAPGDIVQIPERERSPTPRPR